MIDPRVYAAAKAEGKVQLTKEGETVTATFETFEYQGQPFYAKTETSSLVEVLGVIAATELDLETLTSLKNDITTL